MTPALPPNSRITFFLPAMLLDFPPDGGAARKADHLDAIVSDQQAGIFVRERQHVEPAIRPSCVLHDFRHQQDEQSGVWGAGFSTIGHPAAIAGATLCATRLSGKLNGVIPAIGPSGNGLTMPHRPAVYSCQSSGRYSP